MKTATRISAMADLLSNGFQNLTLNQQELLKTTSPDEHIIVFLAQQQSSTSPGLISACTLSSHVYLLDASTLHVSSVLDLGSSPRKDKKRVLSHALFGASSGDPNALFAVSREEGVFRWDVRIASKPAQAFQCKPISSLGINFLSLDLSCDGRVLASGSSATPDGDAFIGFWDTRAASSGAFLGVYSESHSDDVTSLAFQPSKPSCLLSGGGDGLLCCHDLNAREEEDALTMACNAERSLARVGWHASNMFCISDMETFHVWNSDGDIQKEVTSLPESWQYIVDCLSDGDSLLIGNHEGQLAVLPASQKEPSFHLSGGHSDTVRSSLVLPGGHLMTGGEDGMLCVWHNTEGSEEPAAKKLKLSDGTPKKRTKVSFARVDWEAFKLLWCS